MNKRSLVLLLVILFVSSFCFAEEGLVASGRFVIGEGKLVLDRFSIQSSETRYISDEEFSSAPLFKMNIGVDISPSKMFGASIGAFGGYSFQCGKLLRLDVAGGVEFFESSVIAYFTKKVAKEEYSFTTAILPTLDLSVALGLEDLSVRAGVKGSYQISKNLGNGIGIAPYIGITASLLK